LYFLFYFFLRFSAPSGFPWASWHVDCWWCTVQSSWSKACFCNLYYLYGNYDHVKLEDNWVQLHLQGLFGVIFVSDYV
jgi:hypothetical protein